MVNKSPLIWHVNVRLGSSDVQYLIIKILKNKQPDSIVITIHLIFQLINFLPHSSKFQIKLLTCWLPCIACWIHNISILDTRNGFDIDWHVSKCYCLVVNLQINMAKKKAESSSIYVTTNWINIIFVWSQ